MLTKELIEKLNQLIDFNQSELNPYAKGQMDGIRLVISIIKDIEINQGIK